MSHLDDSHRREQNSQRQQVPLTDELEARVVLVRLRDGYYSLNYQSDCENQAQGSKEFARYARSRIQVITLEKFSLVLPNEVI